MAKIRAGKGKISVRSLIITMLKRAIISTNDLSQKTSCSLGNFHVNDN